MGRMTENYWVCTSDSGGEDRQVLWSLPRIRSSGGELLLSIHYIKGVCSGERGPSTLQSRGLQLRERKRERERERVET